MYKQLQLYYYSYYYNYTVPQKTVPTYLLPLVC